MNHIVKILSGDLQNPSQKPAFISHNSKLTYADLTKQVLFWALFLDKYQIRPGDVVAVNVKSEALHYQLTLALLLCGARHFTLASHDSPLVHQQLTDILVPKLILSDTGMATAGTIPVIRVPSGAELRSAISVSRLPLLGDFDQHIGGSVLLKTSGTTGGINIIELTAHDLSLQASRHPEYAQDGLLRFASIEHNNSKRHRLYAFMNGGLNVFGSITDDMWVNAAKAGDLKILDISRLHILELLHRFPEGLPKDLKVRTGGSAIPQALRHIVLEKLTPNLFVRYATTEFGGIAMAGPTMHDIAGCAGAPLPGVVVDIVDWDGSPKATGEVGRLRLKGPGAAQSYLFSTNPQQTAERFDGDFFYPGDLGYLDSHGRLIISGRQDDMIIMNGLNIFPDEVQAELEALPDVLESVCFPVTSRQHGQIPAAVVKLAPGCSTSETDLIRQARSRLALKTPKRIFIVDNIPLNSAGKYDKVALMARFGL